ncbi:tRNA lysidine(34) synthetase TilS [Candidatus Sumerlaeota bacterium]|nr:tRNA lysidine(34) synthetase TilS [Candidatus Sumerlaeota bacterium]
MAPQPDWRTVAAQSGAVLVAVSGGADSVYLCHHLKAHIPQRTVKFVIAHVNHRTRGVASDEDEDFVRALAQRIGWEFHAQRIDPSMLTANASEAGLRDARLQLLKSLARALGISVIAFGHHANDLAEGFLLAALRGSGPRGLAAMTTVRRIGDDFTFIRPLLAMTRAEIEGALRTMCEAWRDDATNAETHAKRNFLRQRVIPLLLECDPSAVEGIAESAMIAGEVEAVYSHAVQEACGRALLTQLDHEILFSARVLRECDTALLPGVLRAMSTVMTKPIKTTTPILPRREVLRAACDRITTTDGDEATFPLLQDTSLWLSNEHGLLFRNLDNNSLRESLLRVSGSLPLLLLATGIITVDDADSPVSAKRLSVTEACMANDAQRSAWIDEAGISGRLVVRRFTALERISTGNGTSKSVRTCLQEHRVPRPLRPDVAGVCDDAGILWIPHMARAKRALVNDDTVDVIRLSLK